MPSKGTRCWGCRQFTRAANLAHTYCCYHWMMSAAFSSRPTESTGKKNGDTGTVLTGDSRQGTQTSNERKKRRRRQTSGPAMLSLASASNFPMAIPSPDHHVVAQKLLRTQVVTVETSRHGLALVKYRGKTSIFAEKCWCPVARSRLPCWKLSSGKKSGLVRRGRDVTRTLGRDWR